MTLPVRRVAAALALGAALVTAGCGTTEAGRAATVDGRVITQDQVATAQAEINKAFPNANLSSSAVLARLINAPYQLDFVAQQGSPQSESVARANFPAGTDPSPEAVEVLRGELAIAYLQQAGVSIPMAVFEKLKVEVNPRYGTYDPSTASLTPTTPSWIKPAGAPAAK
ncbi:hypothetical protein [Phycicoccus avicenniae]|uniref:hypothetical protein n=1 Tax=Phycicoccus avicenniae TaxID=2828860 RepID=UPI003D27FB47